MNSAHTDAPAADPVVRQIYDWVMGQYNPDLVIRSLIPLLREKILTAPGYKQPNGFWTLKLGDMDGTGDNLLRLHYWPLDPPPPVHSPSGLAGIHDHIFDFTSLVLAGNSMTNTVYWPESTDEPGSDRAGLYRIHYVDPYRSRASLVAYGVQPRIQRFERIYPRAYYSLPAGEFHSSGLLNRFNDDVCFTLMATKRDSTYLSPRCLFDTKFGEEIEMQRVLLTDADRAVILDASRIIRAAGIS